MLVFVLLIISLCLYQANGVCDYREFGQRCQNPEIPVMINPITNIQLEQLCNTTPPASCFTEAEGCITSFSFLEFLIKYKLNNYTCTEGRSLLEAFQVCLSSETYRPALIACSQISDRCMNTICMITESQKRCNSGLFVCNILTLEALSPLPSSCGTSTCPYLFSTTSDTTIESTTVVEDINGSTSIQISASLSKTTDFTSLTTNVDVTNSSKISVFTSLNTMTDVTISSNVSVLSSSNTYAEVSSSYTTSDFSSSNLNVVTSSSKTSYYSSSNTKADVILSSKAGDLSSSNTNADKTKSLKAGDSTSLTASTTTVAAISTPLGIGIVVGCFAGVCLLSSFVIFVGGRRNYKSEQF